MDCGQFLERRSAHVSDVQVNLSGVARITKPFDQTEVASAVDQLGGSMGAHQERVGDLSDGRPSLRAAAACRTTTRNGATPSGASSWVNGGPTFPKDKPGAGSSDRLHVHELA